MTHQLAPEADWQPSDVQRERDEWRDRAIAAEGRLYRAQERLMEIFD